MSQAAPFQADDKDPGSTIPYTIDWTDELAGDTIVSSSWNVPPPFRKVNESFSNALATVVISGGAVGKMITITNTIQTATAATEVRSIQIYCRKL